jgi:hypothetical protein
MTVKEAGRQFGISPDGVRQRVRRGNLESERGDDGRVYVWVDTAVQNPDNVGERRTPVEKELRERIESLERQLERRDEEIYRAHQLLGESLSQLRTLNAPESTQSDTHSASDDPPAGTPPEPESRTSQSLTARFRRWWRGG